MYIDDQLEQRSEKNFLFANAVFKNNTEHKVLFRQKFIQRFMTKYFHAYIRFKRKVGFLAIFYRTNKENNLIAIKFRNNFFTTIALQGVKGSALCVAGR